MEISCIRFELPISCMQFRAREILCTGDFVHIFQKLCAQGEISCIFSQRIELIKKSKMIDDREERNQSPRHTYLKYEEYQAST